MRIIGLILIASFSSVPLIFMVCGYCNSFLSKLLKDCKELEGILVQLKSYREHVYSVVTDRLLGGDNEFAIDGRILSFENSSLLQDFHDACTMDMISISETLDALQEMVEECDSFSKEILSYRDYICSNTSYCMLLSPLIWGDLIRILVTFYTIYFGSLRMSRLIGNIRRR